MKYKNDIYKLSINNIGKKLTENYDNLIIPEIEKITRFIQGDVIKNKIYNYIVYYYNKGILKGYLDTINIYSLQGNKKIYFKIKENKIILKLRSK